MPLHELGSVPAALAWLARRGARALTTDSRRVADAADAAFIAWPGYANDARQFVAKALDDGAVAAILEADGVAAFNFARSERLAVMRGLKAQTGPLASGFFGAPSDRLKVVAATGTNGKTSTAWWTAQALTALGSRCGVVGTLGIGEPPTATHPARIVYNGLTTPDPVTLHAGFRRMVDDGFAACAIEASSIGLDEHRLSGTHIDVALLTNVTQDHLDYHGTMEAYWQAKAQLFSWPGLRAAVLNIDDAHGAALAEKLRATSLDLWTYSTTQPARLQARDIGYVDGGLAFTMVEGPHSADVRSSLIGDYNVANLLAAVGGLRALGVPLADAAAACASLTPVPGRMQRVSTAEGQPEVVVDYAHSPDALDKALHALQPLAATRGGALWCVFGCGGNRDGSKRPLMGALARRLAQHVVVTSDNPRHEAPGAIIDAVVAGMRAGPAPQVIEDRRAAIAHAVARAQPRDVILLAGKGHEDYQDVAGVKHPFDDAVEARKALAARSERR